MLFNCFSCCKAISSNTGTCPYCMVETTPMVQQMEPENPAVATQERRRWGFLLKRSAYKAERKAKELTTNIGNIPHIVNKLRIANH